MLNYPETVAMIGAVIVEDALDGRTDTGVKRYSTALLACDEVWSEATETFPEIPVTATFPDGNRRLTVHRLTV